MKHVDELTLLRMVDGELAREREAQTRSHLIECAACQAKWEALKTETEMLRATLRQDEEPLPEEMRPRGGISSVIAAALLLGALGITSFWNRIVEPLVVGMDRVGLDGPTLFTSIFIRGLLYRGWTDMASTLTTVVSWVLLAASLAAVTFWAWRHFRHTGLALGLVLGFGALPGAARAAVIELDRKTYSLPAGETIANDLVVAAEIVRIEGTLEGDLIVAARLVEVSGSIHGDVLGFAEEIDVTGEVGGNIRTGSRSLDIEGAVARNVTAAGETLRFQSGARIGGGLIAAGREIILSATVERDLLMAAEIHEIDSRIGGSALLAGERLVVGPGAAIEGPVRFYGANEPEVSPQAQLASPVEYRPADVEEDESPLDWLGQFVFFWAAAFVLGAAFVLLAPEAAEAITALHLPDYGKSFLVGLLALGAGLALAVALLVTVVGIPLGLVTLFLWLLGLYAAQVYVGVYVGRRLLGRPTDRSQLLVRLAVGLLAVHIAKSIPFLGHVVSLVVMLWGFGALTLWILDRLFRSRREPAGAPT